MASTPTAERPAAAHDAHEGRLPFAVVMVFAFASVLIPSGTPRLGWVLAAMVLTALVLVARQLSPWRRMPRAVHVLPLILATAAIGCLIYSAGRSTGLNSLLLLPLMYSAFYGAPWESAVLIPAIGITLAVTGIAAGNSPLVLMRLLVFWVALLSMMSFVAHQLRARLQRSVTLATEEARRSTVIADATRVLTTALDPALVISTAARLAAELASPVLNSARRGQYFTATGDAVTLAADSDESGATGVGTVFPAGEHPQLRQVLQSGEPVNGVIEIGACGPAVRRLDERLGITHGAYVPIRLEGAIHGVLSASGRGHEISPQLFQRLLTLGNVTELALANASAHQRLETQALTDPLTKLANRRELEHAFARMPDRLPFAILAADLDNLKRANDRYGHAAGDAVITAVATAMAAVVRRGDTVARVGGDEFAVLMLDATVEGAELLAARIHEAVERIDLLSGTPRLSIGCCVAPCGTDSGFVQGVADSALYEAKHRGGSCTVMRVFDPAEPVLAATG